LAAAMLYYYTTEYKGCEVLRTTDEEKLKTADLLFDVGGVYYSYYKKYDHNQETFTNKYY